MSKFMIVLKKKKGRFGLYFILTCGMWICETVFAYISRKRLGKLRRESEVLRYDTCLVPSKSSVDLKLVGRYSLSYIGSKASGM